MDVGVPRFRLTPDIGRWSHWEPCVTNISIDIFGDKSEALAANIVRVFNDYPLADIKLIDFH